MAKDREAGCTALLLIRTPLQAWIAQRVIQAEAITEYDLVYFTHDDSEEDRHYYSELARGASKASYLHAPRQRFNIMSQLTLYRQARALLRDHSRQLTLMASIDAPIPNAIAARQSGELVTFDDGTANFNPGSHYHTSSPAWRDRLYGKLLGAEPLDRIKKRISYHYTIYPGFKNIVEDGRLKPLGPRGEKRRDLAPREPASYFIGQPFEEVLTSDQASRLEAYLQKLAVDYYVQHPREREPLNIGAAIQEKRGLIAEDLILQHAKTAEIKVFGWFSTVLFNLGDLVAHRTMILLESDPRSLEFARLAQEAGCSVELI